MKHFFTICTIIFAFSISIFASANTTPTPDNSSYAILRLKPKSGNTGGNRCPAMPIYGTYDGYTLSIDVVADDEAATYELVVTTAATQTVGQYTAVELNQGVAVPPLQPATIELTTPAGAVYVGEITD